MNNANKLLGLRIKKLREAKERTQSDLAALTNLSLKNLGELERGRGNPSLKSLISLAHVPEVSLSELFDFELESKSDEALKAEACHRLQQAKPDVVKVIYRALKP